MLLGHPFPVYLLLLFLVLLFQLELLFLVLRFPGLPASVGKDCFSYTQLKMWHQE